MVELYTVMTVSLLCGWLCFFVMLIGTPKEYNKENFLMFGVLAVLCIVWPVAPLLIVAFNTWLKKTGRW